MNYVLDNKEFAKEDIRKHKLSGQKQLVKKIEKLLIECLTDSRTGTDKPERLKFMTNETWSREIKKQHRLIYEIQDFHVIVLSAWGHYDINLNYALENLLRAKITSK